jgi:hypothetical protein
MCTPFVEEVSSTKSPGWSGAHRWMINRIERRAILKRLASHRHQGPHQMARMIPVLLVSIGVWGNAQACDTEMDNASADKFSSSFRELRSTKGHFEGGNWSREVDAWGGAKHVAMQCLALHATAQKLSAAALGQLMGAPDETLRCPSSACSALLRHAEWRGGKKPPRGVKEVWIYRWRGEHDRLALALSHGAVLNDGWLLVHE